MIESASSEARVLDAIRRGRNSFSKKDLVGETGIPWTSVCKVVDNLLAKGFAFSRRETPSGRGRPSIPLCVNSGAGYFAGIDIGASQTKTVFCDLAFNIVHRRCDATLEYDGSGSFLNWLSELFESALSESRVERDKLLGLGLAVSGNVDSETGVIWSGGNFGMKWGAKVPAAQAMRERFGIPTMAITTNSAGVWGEYNFGAKAGCSNLVSVGLGVGIGSGVVSNDKLLVSQPGHPIGYIGHILASDNKYVCSCGFRGCLEAYCGGKSLAKVAKELLPRRPELHDARALDLAAASGDGDAAAIMLKAASYNAVGIASMIQLYSPGAIVFSGGQSRRDGFLYEATISALGSILPEERRRSLSLSLSTLGGEQSALGAARLAFEKFF